MIVPAASWILTRIVASVPTRPMTGVRYPSASSRNSTSVGRSSSPEAKRRPATGMSSATVSPVATVIAATSHLTGPAVATVCRRAASMTAVRAWS